MTVLWTQIKKDLRSIRWFLLVWLVIEAGLAMLVGSGVDARAVDDRTMLLLNTEYRIGMILATAMFALVAIALVQADRLVGTTAFWLTRPVGRSTLLASKAIVAVVFLVVVPAALDAIVFATNGVTPPALWQAAALQAAGQLLYLLPVMAIAALTPNIARFSLTAVIGVLALMILTEVFDPQGLPGRPMGSIIVGVFAALTVMALAFLAVIVHQYLTRRSRRSSFVAVAGLAGALVVQQTWPWPMPATPPPAVDVRQFDPTSVTLAADHLRLGVFGITASLEAEATVEGVPEGFEVKEADARVSLRFASGAPVRSSELPYGSQAPNGAQPAMLRHALGPVRVVYSRQAYDWSPESSLYLMRFPQGILDARGNQTATCRADVVLGVWTDRVVAEVPARAGTRLRYGGDWQGDILGVAAGPNGIEMRTRESGRLRRLEGVGDRYYVLLNKSRGEAVVGTAISAALFWAPIPFVPSTGTLDVLHRHVDFSTYYAGDREVALNQAWLDGATLVIVETVRIGTFTRSFDFGHVVLASLPRR